VAGDIGLREPRVERGNPLGHPDLVFLPERARKGRVVGEFVFLHRNGLVL
jgi:hypothetical protein